MKKIIIIMVSIVITLSMFSCREKCFTCFGDKIITCTKCAGSGYHCTRCSDCYGQAGFVQNCKTCKGTGVVRIEAYGDAKCWYCDGAKKIPCPDCNSK